MNSSQTSPDVDDGRHAAVFLDRDGTLIPDHDYLANVEGVTLLPGVAEGLRDLAAAGHLLVLVTNQSGIGRGLVAADIVEAQHERLCALLAAERVQLAGIKVCPHAPDAGCGCRKPLPGMVLEAAGELGIDCERSWMIGDRTRDVDAGVAAGCRGVLISPDEGVEGYDCRRDFASAVAAVLERSGGNL